MHSTTFTCRALVSTTLIKMETFFMNSKNSKLENQIDLNKI